MTLEVKMWGLLVAWVFTGGVNSLEPSYLCGHCGHLTMGLRATTSTKTS